jgi:hypothetical protein
VVDAVPVKTPVLEIDKPVVAGIDQVPPDTVWVKFNGEPIHNEDPPKIAGPFVLPIKLEAAPFNANPLKVPVSVVGATFAMVVVAVLSPPLVP